MPPAEPVEINFLTVDLVERIHKQILEPGEEDHVLDHCRLGSAVGSPQAASREGYLNSSIFEMAAALIIGIACNHPFANGNKRTAMMSGIVFLGSNGYQVKLKNKKFADLILDVVEKRVNKASLTKILRRKTTIKKSNGNLGEYI